ncbi:hypothetical protein JCM16775_1351 [Leptotrichia hofstadii]|uniref:Lipoprotein n=1 Tax=Leptotrichia hofstadii TaxID=157688 RepID=A0A510JH43_9FUSO|nr:hypothetical protein [Leptotrichia hofstadii]BBM38642.1 hypothetical protein JCM16775_1351 [Leptotrichia hofstadii]
MKRIIKLLLLVSLGMSVFGCELFHIKKQTKLIEKLSKDVKQKVDTNIVEMQVFKLFLLTK